MIDFFTILLNLTIRLLPGGRGFKVPAESFQKDVYRALARSESDWVAEHTGILDELLADNDNFTEEDAAIWERRLAILASQSSSLEDRKAAIRRKYASPGDIPARQHYLYLQRELQAAGFNVFVHETPKDPNTGEPLPIEAFIGIQLNGFQLGDDQLGPTISELDVIANFIDKTRDESFVIPDDKRALFYIGGETLGSVATVDANREDEFRQLILLIKPLQTVGILLINYN